MRPLHLEFSHTKVSATRTTTSTLSAQRPFSLEQGIAAHIVVFSSYIFEKKLHIFWLYFVPPCFFFFKPTLLTIFHLTHGFTWALCFVFFVFHLISEQRRDVMSRDTVAFFFPDGLVVSRHPVLLCTLDISCFYGSFLFGTGGVRRPD